MSKTLSDEELNEIADWPLFQRGAKEIPFVQVRWMADELLAARKKLAELEAAAKIAVNALSYQVSTEINPRGWNIRGGAEAVEFVVAELYSATFPSIPKGD